MKGVKKQNLPEKVCATCGRPFLWRKKWERVWDAVRYCSEACRKRARRGTASDHLTPHEITSVRLNLNQH
jgi:hypothetical protein